MGPHGASWRPHEGFIEKSRASWTKKFRLPKKTGWVSFLPSDTSNVSHRRAFLVQKWPKRGRFRLRNFPSDKLQLFGHFLGLKGKLCFEHHTCSISKR